MMPNRKYALITGIALLIMAVAAGFAIGYALPLYYAEGALTIAAQTFTSQQPLYLALLSSIVVVLLLDLLVSWTLYKYFEADSKKWALISLGTRIIYTLLFGLATWYLFANPGVTDADTLTANFRKFEAIWMAALIIFGLHLLAVAILMRRHQPIPKILWIITLIAAVSYIVVHLLRTFFPAMDSITTTLNNILALPMALGELLLALWLILRGGRTRLSKV